MTWIDSEGEARVALDRELMLTPQLGIFGGAEYDSEYGVGGGLTVRF